MIRLDRASLTPPPGLEELISDLGDGENGFMGTPVHRGEATLREYLLQCCDMPDPAKLRPGLVPQTVFWVLDEHDEAVGIVRLRHYLNEKLKIGGGHIGYYVRSDQRGQGYGKEMLHLALAELRALGEKSALITPNPDNAPSIRMIEANGGRFQDIVTDETTGVKHCRYWVDIDPQQPPEPDK
jgi:predicted acetyltransferase